MSCDSIGIGSHLNDVLALYPIPDQIIVDTSNLPPGEPPGIAYDYFGEGLTFWTSPVDSSVFEIHIIDTLVAPVSGNITSNSAIKRNVGLSPVARPHHYRRRLSAGNVFYG